LEWLMSEETQLKWVQMGGYSALQSVLDSDTFKNAAPFNPVFSEAYPLVKDFYNLPEYQPLMTKEGEYLNLAVTGQMSAQEALDALAADQQAIIEEAYPDGPPQ
jgi:multiple sugar transport system substrate-binding protein